MKTPHTARRLLGGSTLALMALATAGCGLEEQAVPGLTGPSGLANAITLTASPSQLPRDGSSAATVTVTATDVTGGPLAGQRVGLAVTPSDATLSTTEVTTDSTGRATFTVTAPPSGSGANDISITATPIGGFSDSSPKFVSIVLTGTPVGSVATPTVTLAVSPDPPVVNQNATFSATATPAAGHRITQYSWDFGDGSAVQTTTQPTVIKKFTKAGVFVVTVTVTDDLGQTGSTSLQVTVAAVASPTVTFTVSPASPVRNQQATFSATATPGTGRSITQYAWTFGDGSASVSTTSATINRTYTSSGVFAVTVTVTDDIGQTGSTTQQVTVTADVANPPTVSGLTVSPSSPVADQTATITVTATPATGRRISTFAWTFSDGGSQTTSNPTTTYSFGTPGTNTIHVAATDDLGQTGSTTTTITVTGITPAFTMSPTNPRINQTVQFDPRTTKVPSGLEVDEYQWDFGCTAGETCTTATATTTPGDDDGGVATTQYTVAKTFTIRLTVVDTKDRTYTTTLTLAVSSTFSGSGGGVVSAP